MLEIPFSNSSVIPSGLLLLSTGSWISCRQPHSHQELGSILGCEFVGDAKEHDRLCQGHLFYPMLIMTGCRWAEGKTGSRTFL